MIQLRGKSNLGRPGYSFSKVKCSKSGGYLACTARMRDQEYGEGGIVVQGIVGEVINEQNVCILFDKDFLNGKGYKGCEVYVVIDLNRENSV